MSGEDALEDDDFDVEEGDAGRETETAEVVVKIVNSEARRRLEDRLEERRLQKLIGDYEYDID
ncbi:PA3496 family putative envelope integrity protein [Porticoccus sp.]|uniref:PA3496 family putative envelope integrity protein n=1 Tax=Porticoccus sp. TaxID=2024853 RepID=UPI003F69E60B